MAFILQRCTCRLGEEVQAPFEAVLLVNRCPLRRCTTSFLKDLTSSANAPSAFTTGSGPAIATVERRLRMFSQRPSNCSWNSLSCLYSASEFAYASTYNSGGMHIGTGGMNEVDTGNDRIRTYAPRVEQGEWHLYDDVRTVAAPTWKEKCGRCAMSG
ncbi:hypothetical protein [Streptomyces sp. Je 1-332]|uniref:hypothetical protein n=1 Tax=Streptomyces sp. Je 1-332 TaxID=3231270 RepID=UPI0034576880